MSTSAEIAEANYTTQSVTPNDRYHNSSTNHNKGGSHLTELDISKLVAQKYAKSS